MVSKKVYGKLSFYRSNTMTTEILNISNVIDKWKKIFCSNNPFLNPFNEDFDFLVLYPTDGYHLTVEQYEAFIRTLREMGEEGFWLAISEYEGVKFSQDEIWWCDYPNYTDYLDYPITLENSLFSNQGRWGVMVSHEDHALLGATSDDLKLFKNNYDGWEKGRENFLSRWSGDKWALELLGFTE